MWVINVRTHDLQCFNQGLLPAYAILSHTWCEEEVTFKEMQEQNQTGYSNKPGWRKIMFTCDQAFEDGIAWAWVDSCCIDKSSSAELSEAINSMFAWYCRATVCYAFLEDVFCNSRNLPCDGGRLQVEDLATRSMITEASVAFDGGLVRSDHSEAHILDILRSSRCFTRRWALQELIAPEPLRFYDADWYHIGNRADLVADLQEIRGIDTRVLLWRHQSRSHE
ncbi:hypothetical protein EJ03DRAFT_123111 [Teratosphaeria nubilosa]|uniref:Heterokaryon incompatibility domain-containing protein n=1 Tax=Teratosphaeria nubilosa TaxID=161662 RepID=A0A6G1L5Q1_9PEZI|nr:hypothetical protein EJ03DRAFT_123111 [Teratosphaeria nubilosa]